MRRLLDDAEAASIEAQLVDDPEGRVVAMGLAFIMVLVGSHAHSSTFFGMFVSDSFSIFMKCLVLIGAAVTLIMGMGYVKREGMNRFEFPILILFATLGMLLMISAND